MIDSAACTEPPPINNIDATMIEDAPTLNFRMLYEFFLFFMFKAPLSFYIIYNRDLNEKINNFAG